MRLRRTAAVIGKAIASAAFAFFFVFGTVAASTQSTTAATMAAVASWIGSMLFPWRRFWRREWTLGRLGRGRHRRLVLAGVIVVAGAASCIASDYWFGTHASNGLGRQVIGVQWDLVVGAPFALIALLVLTTGMSSAGGAVTATLLALLCVLSYEAVTSSDDSTAGIGYLIPWTTGIPLIGICYVVDAAARGFLAGKAVRRDPRRVI